MTLVHTADRAPACLVSRPQWLLRPGSSALHVMQYIYIYIYIYICVYAFVTGGHKKPVSIVAFSPSGHYLVRDRAKTAVRAPYVIYTLCTYVIYTLYIYVIYTLYIYVIYTPISRPLV